MDKITRVLFLYAELIKGKKVNKQRFCLETGSKPRSFDRDIQNIRGYLSDYSYGEEIVYDRRENVYYIKKGVDC